MQLIASRSPKTRFYVAPLCLLFAAVAPAFAAGCGTSGTALCADVCDCEGCSTTAEQSCEATASDNTKEANDVGCGSELSTYESCYLSQGQCIGAKYQSGGCDVELQKLTNCLSSAKCNLDPMGAIHC